jgi:hypothetical protein
VKFVCCVALLPLNEHVTEIGQLPGVVFVPMSHDRTTIPFASANFGVNPCAVDGPDLYVTVIEQDAPGAVFTAALAAFPCATGLDTLVKVTVSVLLAGGAVVGVVAGAG